MKLTIKTLKGEIFSVEAQSGQTVTNVKQKIKEEKGFAVEAQKLVFKGKNTTNTDTLENLGVKQADFMVVMVAAAKKVEQKPVEKKQQKAPQKVEQTAQSEEQKTQKPTTGGGMGLVSNQEYQASLNQLISMGFDRQTAVSAMKAAYNNLQRAVEYCCNGIPQRPQPSNSSTGVAPGTGVQGGEGGALDPSLLLGLVSSPQFAQIRQLVQSNPSALPNILQSISQSSPQLFQLISQNPELFEQLLLGDLPQIPQSSQSQPGAIHVTNQQKQAIERLASLGFPKIEAAQAYIACDKNQQLAANLLFDRLANGDFQPQPQQSNNQGNQGGQNNDKKDQQDDNDNLFS